MGFTPAELKEATDRLKHDQVNWQSKKKQLERTIAKHNLTLDDLLPRLKQLTVLLDEKNADYARLENLARKLTEDIAQNERVATSTAMKSDKAQAILTDLEAVIAHKREAVDTDLQAWVVSRREEYKTQLVGVQEALATTTQTLSSVEAELTAKRDELDSLRQATASERVIQRDEIIGHDTVIKGLLERRVPLEADIDALTVEVTKLERQRSVQLADTKRGKAEFDGFLDYEQRARKVLETKDRELQDKAQELAQEDRHIKARRSYLADL